MSDFDIILNTDVYKNYEENYEKKISTSATSPYLTKYEKAKVLGLRAQQIATSNITFTEVPKGMTNVIDIARKELEERKIPFIIKRKIGKNKYEYWKLEDLHY